VNDRCLTKVKPDTQNLSERICGAVFFLGTNSNPGYQSLAIASSHNPDLKVQFESLTGMPEAFSLEAIFFRDDETF
jgi:hypothetical protein